MSVPEAIGTQVSARKAGSSERGQVGASSTRPASFGWWRRWGVAYLYLLPSILGSLIFVLIPVVAVFVLSFFHWDLVGTPRFTGLNNYKTLFESSLFWYSLRITIEYVAMTVIPLVVLSLGLAMLLNRKFVGGSAFRTIAVLPWLATPVAIGVIWEWIFNPQTGVVNSVLGFLGLPEPAWLSSFTLALPTVAFVMVWQFLGYNMLFFLAGLQGIPRFLYEAAQLDGARPVQVFLRITLPLLRPTMLFVLVIDMISSFQVFDTIYIMTNGGPGYSTYVLNVSIYEHAFAFLNVGYASALSMVLFIIILTISMLQFRYFRNRIVYEMN